jgi:hypothetical protein
MDKLYPEGLKRVEYTKRNSWLPDNFPGLRLLVDQEAGGLFAVAHNLKGAR